MDIVLVEQIHHFPILAYDVVYNRESTAGQAYYWSNADELVELLSKDNLDGTMMRTIAEEQYTWKKITEQYEALY